jgi:hypothetical protein
MEKLIVVGMRFCDASAVKEVERLVAKGTSTNISLREEANVSGVGGRSLAVMYDGTRVGYVRNTDLPMALNSHRNYLYKIRKCNANYWILDCTLANIAAAGVTSIPAGYSTDTSRVRDQTVMDSVTSGIGWRNNPYPNENNAKDEKKMINTNSMRDSFFREVKNVAIDIQSGKFGVVTNEGISVYTDGGVSVNPITDFGVKVPAFAMRVAINDLKAGDIIVGGSEPTFFAGLFKDGGYEVVTMNGEHKVIGTVTNMFFGKNTVLAVKNMFGEGVNPMMMALMMGDDKKGEGFDMKTFALMSMMGNTAGKEGGMDSNMLMMMMLMGK